MCTIHNTVCEAECKTCYYDSDGNKLCAECNVGYVFNTDKKSCESMSCTIRSLGLVKYANKCDHQKAPMVAKLRRLSH